MKFATGLVGRKLNTMKKGLSMSTRKEITDAIRDRYREASRPEKGRILDEFVKTTSYHRKHALRLMAGRKKAQHTIPRRRVYDESVGAAMTLLWEAGDRMCGKRLKAALPSLMESLEVHGHLVADNDLRLLLTQISPATIDRMLQPVRIKAGGPSRRKKRPNVIQRQVPVRTSEGGGSLPPGYIEADFVVHSGGVMPGSCVHTFSLTDVCSGWTECVALTVRDQSLVVESLRQLRPQMPIPMLGLDTDNDGAFLNATLFDYLKDEGIEQTRSRPYKKNDQAWIEQKNGSVVRHFAGYGRFEGLEDAETLCRLYKSVRLFVNYFQPSFKLKAKKREGARVKKYYHPPATPCDRLLGNPLVSDAIKSQLRDCRATLDPVVLLHEIREAQAALAKHAVSIEPKTLDQFVQGLSSLAESGEANPAQIPKPRKKLDPRTWRTRKDPFQKSWPQIQEWLEAEPDATAGTLMPRLQLTFPGEHSHDQLRTLQRRVKKWRAAKAKDVFLGNYAGRHHFQEGAHSDSSELPMTPASIAG